MRPRAASMVNPDGYIGAIACCPMVRSRMGAATAAANPGAAGVAVNPATATDVSTSTILRMVLRPPYGELCRASWVAEDDPGSNRSPYDGARAAHGGDPD